MLQNKVDTIIENKLRFIWLKMKFVFVQRTFFTLKNVISNNFIYIIHFYIPHKTCLYFVALVSQCCMYIVIFLSILRYMDTIETDSTALYDGRHIYLYISQF